MANNDSAEKILRKSRMNLLMEKSFWGELALRLRLVRCNQMPTTAVDARGNFYYNEEWVKKWTVTDGMFEFGHEIGHVMFRHHARKPAGAIHSIYNMASDQIIDTHLIESGLEQSWISKKMVPKNIQEACRRKDGKIKTSEERYRELVKEMKECPKCKKLIEDFEKKAKGQKEKDDAEQQGNSGSEKGEEGNDSGGGTASGEMEANETSEGSGGGDSEGDQGSGESSAGNSEGGDSGETDSGPGHICGNIRQCCAGSMSETDAETVEEWKQYIVGAAKTAKMKGDLPAFVQDFLTQLEKPSRDWRDIVRAKLSKIYRGRYTLKRPSRRSSAIGVRLPARQPKPEPALAVIDCSGSIGVGTIRRFVSEAAGIMAASGAPEIYLMFHDVVCYDQGYFTKDMLTKIKVTHGGTSHHDVFEKIEELDFKPGVIVCFTDLYSDQMTLKKPACPVIWCHPRGCGEEMDIPFGMKLEVPDDLE